MVVKKEVVGLAAAATMSMVRKEEVGEDEMGRGRRKAHLISIPLFSRGVNL